MSIVDDLRGVLGGAGVMTGADMAPFLTDWRGLWTGTAVCITRPADTGQAVQVLRMTRAAGVPVTLQGGNTGLVGGSVPGDTDGVLLRCDRMARVQGVDATGRTITVDAGVTLAVAQEAAREAGLRLPLSLGSEGTAQVGGLVACNAGGSHAMRFGTTRALVLGIEAVLPDGTVLSDLRGLRKDTFGPDTKQLFIGTEGAFGLVTAATLELQVQPGATATLLLALDALESMSGLLATAQEAFGPGLERFEFMGKQGIEWAVEFVPSASCPISPVPDSCVLMEVTGGDADQLNALVMAFLEARMEAGQVTDGTLAASLGQAEGLWALREAVVEGQRLRGSMLKHDVAVRPRDLPAFIDAATRAVKDSHPGCPVNAFGHGGDGNVHFNVSTDGVDAARDGAISDLVNGIVGRFGGTVAAEHNIGRLKLAAWRRAADPAVLAMWGVLRDHLDPGRLFNRQVLNVRGTE